MPTTRSQITLNPGSDVGTRLDRLEAFASHFGADFYGLPRNKSKVKLEKVNWKVPAEYPFGEETVVPLRAGQTLVWRLAAR